MTNLDTHLIKIEECYGFLETFLKTSRYMACDYLTIADFSIVATMSSIHIICKVDETKWPKVTQWWNELKDLPYYFEGNEKGLSELRNRIEKYTIFEL